MLLGFAVLQRLQTPPDGYIWSSSIEVDFIQWTEDSNQHLNGTLQSVSAMSDSTVKSMTAAFTGVHEGSSISITFSEIGLSTTLTGTLNGDTLTLSVPDQNGLLVTDVFHAASVQDYNTAASALRQRVQQQAAATQSAQATAAVQEASAQATASAQSALDQAVTDANFQLSSDLTNLASDVQSLSGDADFSSALSSYASDWAQMQQDWKQEQADYQNGCGVNGSNVGVVQGDANVVQGDRNSIIGDDNALTGYVNSFNSDLTHVQSDIKAVHADWTALQNAAAADAGGSVSPQFTSSDVNSALSKAQQQMGTANKALQSARSQAAQYDHEADQINTNAQNLVASMHC